MATPENTMLNRLKKKLEDDLGIMIEKTNNVFRSGRSDWDMFFSESPAVGGEDYIPATVIFTEGKYWPKQTELGAEEFTGYVWDNKVTPMQRKWMTERATMGFPCCVLCGFRSPDNYIAFCVGKDGPTETHVRVRNYDEVRSFFLGIYEQW